MRWFWQKKISAPKQEVPETALRNDPFLWRMSDHKLFTLNSSGLYIALDGEEINLYLIQRIRWGEVRNYILSHQGDNFPVGSQYFPQMPMPRQQELLKELDQVERHSHASK